MTTTDPWSGPWADDAQRLLRMLTEAADPNPAQAHARTSHATAAECRYCPLCQGMAIIRTSGPDILDRVAELAAGLAATLRAGPRAEPSDPSAVPDPDPEPDREADSTHGQHADPPADPTPDGTDPGTVPARPRIPPTVRIDITD
jgi:hypothetical protein